jgi:chromosome segregation ATPase
MVKLKKGNLKMKLQEKIDKLENKIGDLKNDIDTYEIDPYEFEDQYCEMLDEAGPVNIAGIEFYPAHVLQEIDPTAYRCGLIDYVNGIELTIDEKYNELVEELEELEEKLQDLYNEIEN